MENILNWYDWMTPTNPYIPLIFSILFTFTIGVLAWLDTKNFKRTLVATVTGVAVVGFVTFSLNAVGFFG